MSLTLYYNPLSPPSRMAWMTLEAVKKNNPDLKYEKKVINLQKGEQKTPEYLAINPRGKVPSLSEGKLNVAESRAIACYVCNRFEKKLKDCDRLYPSDDQARAKVDQMLYVSENINDDIIGYVDIGGVIFGNSTAPNENKLEGLKKALALSESFLQNHEFMAGNHLTIADFFMASPLLLLPMSGFNDYKEYPKLMAWLSKIKALPYFEEVNANGIKMMSDMYKSKLA